MKIHKRLKVFLEQTDQNVFAHLPGANWQKKREGFLIGGGEIVELIKRLERELADCCGPYADVDCDDDG